MKPSSGQCCNSPLSTSTHRSVRSYANQENTQAARQLKRNTTTQNIAKPSKTIFKNLEPSKQLTRWQRPLHRPELQRALRKLAKLAGNHQGDQSSSIWVRSYLLEACSQIPLAFPKETASCMQPKHSAPWVTLARNATLSDFVGFLKKTYVIVRA